MNIPPKDMKTGFIRYSTDIDLEEILLWLEDQDRAGVDGTFHCNRNLTIENHNEGKLLVYIDSETNKAIAYQWGGLITPGILEVRADKRRQGIGKALVEYRINEALINNNCLLRIQCEPASSIPFWKRMGFQLYGNNMKNYAYRLLRKKHDLPDNGIGVPVKISFYPEQRKWNDNTLPIKTFTPYAVQTPNDYVYLSERISFFDTTNEFRQDTVISIHVDGKLIYLDKAKYEEAIELGVSRDNGAFYLDKIKSNKAHKQT